MENTAASLIAHLEANPVPGGEKMLETLRTLPPETVISLDPMTDESSAATSENGTTSFGPA